MNYKRHYNPAVGTPRLMGSYLSIMRHRTVKILREDPRYHSVVSVAAKLGVHSFVAGTLLEGLRRDERCVKDECNFVQGKGCRGYRWSGR